jgi:hypothetical protein
MSRRVEILAEVRRRGLDLKRLIFSTSDTPLEPSSLSGWNHLSELHTGSFQVFKTGGFGNTAPVRFDFETAYKDGA